ncbi:hypothetical protein [Cupriavidus necator]|uniref:hypothetical protein n=1 Tax=Cupriavidus necator TaxID=106590 RepID=UPI0009C376BC|nr:hypothetical protein [Cupriavidus necator]
MHRHLTVEGLTFSPLLDEARTDPVKRHLQESDLLIGEIRRAIGIFEPEQFQPLVQRHLRLQCHAMA